MANDAQQVTDERLAMIAISGASAQHWEVKNIAAECLAHRIAGKLAGSRKQAPVHELPAPSPSEA